MIVILDIFLVIFKYLLIPSFIVGIIGFFIILYAKSGDRDNKKKNYRIGVILFGQTFLTFCIAFGFQWFLETMVRHEFKSFLSKKSLTIEINGKLLDTVKSNKIIRDLQIIENSFGHHSSPIGTINIKIISNQDKINIRLGRDSQIQTEYWVFWDKYDATKDNELGRINSENLE